MKTVTGRVINEEPISLSKAATILSRFVSSENGASQDVSAYLRRASAAFAELKSFHKDINTSSLKETKPSSDAGKDRNPTGEFDEICRVKGVDDLVEKRGKIFRKSETVREEESIHGREQDEIKEDKKKKKKKNKEKDVLDEKVKEKLEDEQMNEERKKEKKNNKEDVIDQKVNEKLEDDQRNEERKKEKKKKRKRDGEIGSEERKSKKKKKSKEIDG